MPQEENQAYIQQKVNPILENLVTQLLLDRPEHLAPFMIQWLSQQTKSQDLAQGPQGGTSELATLKAELAHLRQEVKRLEAEAGEVPTAEETVRRIEASEEEALEEEDDEAEELPPPPAAYLQRKGRASVCAEVYGVYNKKEDWEPPVYSKTEEQKGRIRTVLEQCFMFSSLAACDLDIIINATVEKVVEAGIRLINQGDDGECLYIIEEGQMDCYKTLPGATAETLVKECKAGDFFGELALLYNSPRAASVVAHERSVLWQLDRETFNRIVRDSAAKRRERYEEFLRNVPILSSMEPYERSQMCDALLTATPRAGDVICKQGDVGDYFYILEEGECVATKVYKEGTPAQEVMLFRRGDYFGELALLSGDKRAATVAAKVDCKLLYLNRRTFNLLLGPMEDILRRNTSRYS
mmetsp:Transcript_23435/g.54589  ORF Transcript_23435/g.54589 Transcript_23435/m.54589 type:complete len:411 (-) Transcript_23435:28-1260(-)|eukprot:CAMPEP_0178408404 /NCGR_PEP_ID=MMETSP0689_2-20121128/19922_1 /TAXON_ID=160604 /ORGANISM="Amphidinium massartii, Strain CS-259" /LENGTH=410 /DNA_ID=CAMNT_0020029499 /DNA_START=36 /DNA_END=1268 /DNA_ORIENTATION=+